MPLTIFSSLVAGLTSVDASALGTQIQTSWMEAPCKPDSSASEMPPAFHSQTVSFLLNLPAWILAARAPYSQARNLKEPARCKSSRPTSVLLPPSSSLFYSKFCWCVCNMCAAHLLSAVLIEALSRSYYFSSSLNDLYPILPLHPLYQFGFYNIALSVLLHCPYLLLRIKTLQKHIYTRN